MQKSNPSETARTVSARLRRRDALGLPLALLGLGASGIASADDRLRAAIAGNHRTPENVARDAARRPCETLNFFGIRADMTVAELTPGGGWYTEILAPYLRDRGRLILDGDDPQSSNGYRRRSAERLAAKLQTRPDLYDRAQRAVFEVPRAMAFAPAASTPTPRTRPTTSAASGLCRPPSPTRTRTRTGTAVPRSARATA